MWWKHTHFHILNICKRAFFVIWLTAFVSVFMWYRNEEVLWLFFQIYSTDVVFQNIYWKLYMLFI